MKKKLDINSPIGYTIYMERKETLKKGADTMTINNTFKNDLTNIPAAACNSCGGWANHGGMSQHCDSETPVLDRTGCQCHKVNNSNELTVFSCGGGQDSATISELLNPPSKVLKLS